MIKGNFFNSSPAKPRVLVAPLDWGLGHATRCIPIILTLIEQGCEVIIAADGPVKNLLQKEFAQVEFLPLRGYDIAYSRKKSWFGIKILSQFPKIFLRIRAENKWLKKAVGQYKIDAVISDNRPGLSHPAIPCIYITHQLLIKTGYRFTEWIAQKIHYHFINKYSSCWVPDWQGKNNLAGALSHPLRLPQIPVTYIGPLSRFKNSRADTKYDCCFLLSGPEPQRTIFENIVLKELETIQLKAVVIRGLPEETVVPVSQKTGVEILNHLPATALEKCLLQSKLIIARSGYSTIMDMVKLQKKSVLIPTPGQTEQEYLAAYLQNKKIFYSVGQQGISLEEVLKNVQRFPFSSFNTTDGAANETIKNFAEMLFMAKGQGI